MSTISPGAPDYATNGNAAGRTSAQPQTATAPAGDAGKTQTYMTFDRGASANEVDTVEISDAARQMAEYKPYSPMQPKKALVPDSAEEKKFRELMKSVKAQKSEIMTHIEDAFKKNGISLEDIDKVKLEVDRSGKIVVGGMDDPDKARAIEVALNRDKTLADKMRQFHKDEKELSQQLMDYTGATLFELTMTEQGDINERIRKVNPTAKDEYFWDLAFLGQTRNTVVSRDDIASLGFAGKIDFSGEVDVHAKPEENIRETMESLTGKINDVFESHNAELGEGLETPESGERAAGCLSLSNAAITIDNHGKVTVEGKLSSNEDMHKKGVEIIEDLVREMLNETEENSYHMNIFTKASEVLLRKKAEAQGSGNTFSNPLQSKVFAKIEFGRVGDIDVSLT